MRTISRFFSLSLIVLCLVTACQFTQARNSSSLTSPGSRIQARSSPRYGYIDQTGKVVIQQQFNDAKRFTEGLAAVKVNDKYGYVNSNGEFVIRPQFDKANEFSEGLALVSLGPRNGYIDKTGKIVISAPYEASSFRNGIAVVANDKGVGFIDKTGKYIVEPQFTSFHGNTSLYAHESPTFPDQLELFNKGGSLGHHTSGYAGSIVGGEWLYLDRKGEIVVGPHQAFVAHLFSDGLAAMLVDGKWGYVNKRNQFAISPQFDILGGPFSSGLAPAGLKTGSVGEIPVYKFGYINKTGQFVIKPALGAAKEMSEGLATVCVGESTECIGSYAGEGQWGYIDKTGQFIIKPQFRVAENFINGLAIVSEYKDGNVKYGFINRKGQRVIPTQYDWVYPFQEGIARVKVDGKYGYINEQGNYLAKPIFGFASQDFSEGLALVDFKTDQ